jgi:hypothetical protein
MRGYWCRCKVASCSEGHPSPSLTHVTLRQTLPKLIVDLKISTFAVSIDTCSEPADGCISGPSARAVGSVHRLASIPTASAATAFYRPHQETFPRRRAGHRDADVIQDRPTVVERIYGHGLCPADDKRPFGKNVSDDRYGDGPQRVDMGNRVECDAPLALGCLVSEQPSGIAVRHLVQHNAFHQKCDYKNFCDHCVHWHHPLTV